MYRADQAYEIFVLKTHKAQPHRMLCGEPRRAFRRREQVAELSEDVRRIHRGQHVGCMFRHHPAVSVYTSIKGVVHLDPPVLKRMKLHHGLGGRAVRAADVLSEDDLFVQ